MSSSGDSNYNMKAVLMIAALGVIGIALYQYTSDQFALQAKDYQTKLARQESEYKNAQEKETSNIESCQKLRENIQKERDTCLTEKSNESEKCAAKIDSLAEKNSGLHW